MSFHSKIDDFFISRDINPEHCQPEHIERVAKYVRIRSRFTIGTEDRAKVERSETGQELNENGPSVLPLHYAAEYQLTVPVNA